MNNIDRQYKELLEHILHFGVEKKDRTGTGTKSIFGWQIRHNMKEGFPLLTTKKMAWKTMVTELLWFLRGDTNIKFLVDNGCHIWDGDAYKNYLNGGAVKWLKQTEVNTPFGNMIIPTPYTKEEFIDKIKTDDEFAKKWGELGPIYGQMWRDWDADTGEKIDQIANLINDLKTNPDSRRLMVNAWNPTYIPHCVLPPCHYGFQVYTRELSRQERSDYYYKNGNKEGIVEGSLDRPIFEENDVAYKWYDERNVPTRAISLMWSQRSADLFLGIPFNIASYGLLLEIIAKEVNMVPEDLIGNLGDCHLYLNHIEQAKEQITRTPFELPKLKMNPIFLANLEHKGLDEAINGEVNFELENYQSHPAIKAPLSN